MAPDPASSPAFGAATLNNCEQERIHLAASIQPHGALLVLSEPDYTIVQASANAREFLAADADLAGLPLRKIGGNLWERVRPHLNDRIEAIPIAIRCHLADASAPINALLHHPRGGGLVLELERAGPAADFSRLIEEALQTVRMVESISREGDWRGALAPLCAPLEGEGRRFFLGYGDRHGAMWRAFLDQLDAAATSDAQEARIIEGATSAFLAFELWMDDWNVEGPMARYADAAAALN